MLTKKVKAVWGKIFSLIVVYCDWSIPDFFIVILVHGENSFWYFCLIC